MPSQARADSAEMLRRSPVKRSSQTRRRRRVLIVAGTATLCLLAAVLPVPWFVRAPLSLPLVFVLPGYALAMALSLESEDRAERVAAAIALSIAVVILSSLGLELVLDLNRYAWAAVLFGITIAACGFALARHGTGALPGVGLPRVRPASALLLVLAAAIAAFAVVRARDSAQDQVAASQFTAMWALPPGPGGEALRIGVSKKGGRAARYTVRLARDERIAGSWQLQLDPDQSWTVAVPARFVPGSGPVVASLRRGGSPIRNLKIWNVRVSG
jgi:hypothetical protein